jgi:hypothetical protein
MIMMELLAVILFCWIFFKAVGLAFRMAWGAARIAASLLFAVAVPLLVLCLVFAGGIFLMLPLVLVGIAFGLLKACI